LASVTVVALGATMAVTATASTPEFILSEGSYPVSITGTSGETVFETVAKTAIKCKKGKGKGEISGAKEGKLHIVLEECTSSGVKCNSTGSGAGIILTEGPFKLVLGDLTPVIPALFVEPKELHAECAPFVTAVIKGTLLSLLTPNEHFTDLWEPLIDQKSGTPLVTTYWDSSGKQQHALLQASINSGGFEDAGLGVTKFEATLGKEVEIRTGPLTETTIVSLKRNGGTAGGTSTCDFTAINQTCALTVENISAAEIEISGQEVFERVGSNHLKESYVKFLKPTNECYAPGYFYKGTQLLSNTRCNVELELTRAVPTLPQELRGGYAVKVRQAGLNVAGGTMITSAVE
jgi:hypothetical protein